MSSMICVRLPRSKSILKDSLYLVYYCQQTSCCFPWLWIYVSLFTMDTVSHSLIMVMAPASLVFFFASFIINWSRDCNPLTSKEVVDQLISIYIICADNIWITWTIKVYFLYYDLIGFLFVSWAAEVTTGRSFYTFPVNDTGADNILSPL